MDIPGRIQSNNSTRLSNVSNSQPMILFISSTIPQLLNFVSRKIKGLKSMNLISFHHHQEMPTILVLICVRQEIQLNLLSQEYLFHDTYQLLSSNLSIIMPWINMDNYPYWFYQPFLLFIAGNFRIQSIEGCRYCLG